MESQLNNVREGVRKVTVRPAARFLNWISGGHITPNLITCIGLLGHVGVVFLLAMGSPLEAAAWLVFFGLFDALDGELARLQNSASEAGMFLDSMTDRMKEILIYIGIVFFFETWIPYTDLNFNATLKDWLPAIVVATLGLSMLVTYSNAWGEAVLAKAGKTGHQANKALRLGLGFDLRMLLIVIGLVSGTLPYVLLIIAALSILTVLVRMITVQKMLG